MVKETIQNGVSKLKLVHALLLSVVALAFWAGTISERVKTNKEAVGLMAADIRYIRNYLMGWEAVDATHKETQSSTQAQTPSEAQDQAQSSS